MPKMTGGQALAKSLHREGVRIIFGLPGVQLYHLLDGLYDEADIRFIPVRHEQATTYMRTATRAPAAASARHWWCPAPACKTPRRASARRIRHRRPYWWCQGRSSATSSAWTGACCTR